MQILVCDDCKDRKKEARRVQLGTGVFQPDPAGGPSEEKFDTIDLCLEDALKRLVIVNNAANQLEDTVRRQPEPGRSARPGLDPATLEG